MVADDFVIAILQFGLWSLQRPTVLALRISLTGIYLRTRGVYEEHWLKPFGDGNGIGHIWRGFLLRSVLGLSAGEWDRRKEERESDDRSGGQQRCSHDAIVAQEKWDLAGWISDFGWYLRFGNYSLTPLPHGLLESLSSRKLKEKS